MDRKKLITATALFVGALLVVFVVVSDNPPFDGTSGTMATPDTISGVQPAPRYRAPQIAENDLDLDDPTFVQLMQNEAFREIVQSGDMALILAIEELSRTVDLERVSDLAREGGLENVPAAVATDEYQDLAAIAQEIGLDEVAEMAEVGDFENFVEVVKDEEAFREIHELTRNDQEVSDFTELAKDRPEGHDFSALDVLSEMAANGDLFILKELADSGVLENINPATAESDLREAIDKVGRDSDGELQVDDKGIARPVMQRVEEFGRSEAFERLTDLARTGKMQRINDLARSGGLERISDLARTGKMQRVADLARTGGLERLADLERAGQLEKVAELARTEGFDRTIAFARSETFQRAAELGRTDALERVADLARAGQLERVADFARTEGFDRVVDLARAGQLERVADMARTGELERTMREF